MSIQQHAKLAKLAIAALDHAHDLLQSLHQACQEVDKQEKFQQSQRPILQKKAQHQIRLSQSDPNFWAQATPRMKWPPLLRFWAPGWAEPSIVDCWLKIRSKGNWLLLLFCSCTFNTILTYNGKFGGRSSFNLAIWRIWPLIAKLKISGGRNVSAVVATPEPPN